VTGDIHEGKTDIDIVREVKEGNAEVFGELMARCEGKLTRYLGRFLYDETAITDVLADVLVKAYVNIQSFDEKYPFSAWIYRIAHNEAVNVIKKKKSTPFSWFDPEALVPYFAYSDKAEEKADAQMLKKHLEGVLEKLTPAYREILVLYFYEDLSYKEIALVLKIPISSVGVRINRAKKKAGELLHEDEHKKIHGDYH
jgi:RNA polymerase sigma-70 factor, ECF subfamily